MITADVAEKISRILGKVLKVLPGRKTDEAKSE